MEKLEYLQKLNPYLPYDLVVMSGDSYDTDDRLEHKGVMTYSHSSDDNSKSKDFSITEIAFSENNIVTRIGVIKRKVKPVLKPLSDLYKEIDGKVGIVEIAREVELNFIRYDLGSSCVDLYLTDRKGKKSRFWYDGFKTGSFCLTIYGYGKVNQLAGFQYLFQHHYDVFGLIDKGVAIDLNSISHE